MSHPIFPQQPEPTAKPCDHLASAVTVERQHGGKPAVMDFVALAETIIECQRVIGVQSERLATLGAHIRDTERELMRLRNRVTALEDRNRLLADALTGSVPADENCPGCIDPSCPCD